MNKDWFVHFKRFGNSKTRFDRPSHAILPLSTFPRVVHLFWDAGPDAAPELVKHCIQSWFDLNPTWNVIVWDQDSAPLDRSRFPADMKTAAYSDMLRLHLLRDQGGVWCDATNLCSKPLDSWLLQVMAQTDFFAFDRPGPDRAISSWFLASRPSSYILTAMIDACDDFWSRRDTTTRSYFWFHYIFEFLERTSPQFQEAWSAAPKYSAIPLYLLADRLSEKMTVDELELYRAVPLHKLTYKRELDLQQIIGLLS